MLVFSIAAPLLQHYIYLGVVKKQRYEELNEHE